MMIEERNEIIQLSNRIKEIELKAKTSNDISLETINSIKNELDLISTKDIDQNLNTSIYNLRKKLTRLKNKAYKRGNPNLTKWDIFKQDIANLNDFEDLKALVSLVEEKRNENITNNELEAMEDMYSECLIDIHSKINPYDRDIIIKELNKKMRIFNNRINRVLDDGFGVWLKQLRIEKGYSLKELESISTVTASYIHRLETGAKKTPSLPVIEKLALALDISPKEFFNKLNIMTEEEKKPVDIIELLNKEEFLVNNKKISLVEKNNIINVLNVVLNSKWTERTMNEETANIINAISKLKSIKINTNITEEVEPVIVVHAN